MTASRSVQCLVTVSVLLRRHESPLVLFSMTFGVQSHILRTHDKCQRTHIQTIFKLSKIYLEDAVSLDLWDAQSIMGK